MKPAKWLSVASMFAMSSAIGGASAGTMELGVLTPLSGPNAIRGQQFQKAIEVCRPLRGTKTGENGVKFVFGKTTGTDPELSRSHPQELLAFNGMEVITHTLMKSPRVLLMDDPPEGLAPFPLISAPFFTRGSPPVGACVPKHLTAIPACRLPEEDPDEGAGTD